MDYCVFWSAMDAAKLKYKTHVILDATRSITPEGVATAVQTMIEHGIQLVDSKDLGNGQLALGPNIFSIFTCFVILKYLNKE